ncbi:flagellar rod assembly protein [Planctomyces bekefii]|uniref:Flagellar rod assembly protein n=1 Tax=Planctomyces bekefii TaxID=1653850 RepID=A0A5C6MBP1_9PLAN|nr:flagellar rod assembly protein [Planctomyces bekefii]
MSSAIGPSKGALDAGLSLGRMQAERSQDTGVAGNARAASDREDIKKVANEFESLFLNIVMKAMRNTVQKSGLIDGGNAEEIYKSMLDEEYTKMMAAQRTTGIANQIEDFMLRSQGLLGADQASGKAAGGVGIRAYQNATLQNAAKSATMDIERSLRSKAI